MRAVHHRAALITTNLPAMPFDFVDFDVRISEKPQKVYRVRQPYFNARHGVPHHALPRARTLLPSSAPAASGGSLHPGRAEEGGDFTPW